MIRNANEQMANETNERLKFKDSSLIMKITDEEIERENHKKNMIHEECSLISSDFCSNIDDEPQSDKQGSPFYADPVDAIKEVIFIFYKFS